MSFVDGCQGRASLPYSGGVTLGSSQGSRGNNTMVYLNGFEGACWKGVHMACATVHKQSRMAFKPFSDWIQLVFSLPHHVHLPLWMTFQLIKSFSGSFSERRNRHPKKYHPILLKYWYLPFTFILSLLFICAQHWHHGLCASLARSFSTFGRL